MKTKEKLEKSGWKFDKTLDYNYEIFRRLTERIIYDRRTDTAVSHYNIFGGHLKMLTEDDFNLLTKIDEGQEPEPTSHCPDLPSWQNTEK